MSEKKKNLEQKTDDLQVTQETDNELNLEELDNVAGGRIGILDDILPVLDDELYPPRD